MNEFQAWMADVEAANYSVDEMLDTLNALQYQRDKVMEDYRELELKARELQLKLSNIHAKKRYFEIQLEKVAR
jgi:hypothetical protein